MPQYSSKSILSYSQRAAELILQFIEGKSFAEYNRDEMLRSAVERQLIIVGESINWLYRTNPSTVSQITDYPRIIAFRNRLVHMFHGINSQTVWWILNEKLPITYQEVTQLLQEFEED